MGQLAQQSPATRGKPPLAAAALGGVDIQQYLTFQLTGEMYAVGILNVKEIIEYGSLTEIPMMPAFIRGVDWARPMIGSPAARVATERVTNARRSICNVGWLFMVSWGEVIC